MFFLKYEFYHIIGYKQRIFLHHQILVTDIYNFKYIIFNIIINKT